MGILAYMTCGCFGQRSVNTAELSGKEDILKLLTEAAEFLEVAMQRLYILIASMEQDALLQRARMILLVDRMLHTGREILQHLFDVASSNESLDQDTKLSIRKHLGGLKKLLTRSYFLLDLLKRKDTDIDRRLFRRLKQKGLINIEEDEFPAEVGSRDEETSKQCNLSDHQAEHLMVLVNRARSHVEGNKTKKSSELFRKPGVSCRTSCSLRLTKSLKSSRPQDIKKTSAMQTGPLDVMELKQDNFRKEEYTAKLDQIPESSVQTTKSKSSSLSRAWSSFARRVVRIFVS